MTCIDCDGKAIVVNTVSYQGVVYRIRKCNVCGVKFATIEDLIDYDDKNLRKAFNERWNGEKNNDKN